jgi:Protein of unknown function (DUF1203)
MNGYRIVPMDENSARFARETLTAPGYGHPAFVEVARGYGPCRMCLQTFAEDVDRRILFTFDPFAGHEPFPLPGPIYIHAEECEPYHDLGRFPDGLRFIPMTLNAYATGRRLVAQSHITDGGVEEAVTQLLHNHDVDYIHVRNTEAGCFILRIDRADESESDEGTSKT